MELTCSCGNTFNFGEPDSIRSEKTEGFEFVTNETNEGEETLLIHCLRCDKTICLYDPEVIE